MERGEDMVQDKMKALIETSCQFSSFPNDRFRNFHKSYLIFSFNAVNVDIDYDAQKIYSSNSKPLTTNPVRLFDMRNAVSDQFSYSDLEETLNGCLGTSHLHYMFYTKMLIEYGNFSQDEIDDWSA